MEIRKKGDLNADIKYLASSPCSIAWVSRVWLLTSQRAIKRGSGAN
jgi:hypothetical protein